MTIDDLIKETQERIQKAQVSCVSHPSVSVYSRLFKNSVILQHYKDFKSDIKHYDSLCKKLLDGDFVIKDGGSAPQRLENEMKHEAAVEFREMCLRYKLLTEKY